MDINSKIKELFAKLDLEVSDIKYVGEGVGSKTYRVATPKKTYAVKVGMYAKRRKN